MTDLERFGRHVGALRTMEPKAELPCRECRSSSTPGRHRACREEGLRLAQADYQRRYLASKLSKWTDPYGVLPATR